MGVLATWGKFSTYTDADGYYRVIWQDTTTGQIIMHKFESQPSLSSMERFFDKMIHGSEGVVQEVEFSEEGEADFKVICAYIRSHPTLTLTQWNTYLNGLGAWQKGVMFKAYMYKLSRNLYDKGAITLANYTETTVWTAVRNWIVNTNLDVVKRTIFGYLVTL